MVLYCLQILSQDDAGRQVIGKAGLTRCYTYAHSLSLCGHLMENAKLLHTFRKLKRCGVVSLSPFGFLFAFECFF